jgi:hypothetical protein
VRWVRHRPDRIDRGAVGDGIVVDSPSTGTLVRNNLS